MVVELMLGSPARGIHHGRDAVKGEKKARRDRPPAAAAAGLVRPSSGGSAGGCGVGERWLCAAEL